MTTQIFKLCLILIATIYINSCATFDGNSIRAADDAITIVNFLGRPGGSAPENFKTMSSLIAKYLDPCAKISDDVEACKCYSENLASLKNDHNISTGSGIGYLYAQRNNPCIDLECDLTCNVVARIVYDKPCDTGNCVPCEVCLPDFLPKLQEIINPAPILFSDLAIGRPVVFKDAGKIDYNIGLYQNDVLLGNFKNSSLREKGNGTIIQKFIYDGPQEVRGSTQLRISYKDQVGIQREITKTIISTAN